MRRVNDFSPSPPGAETSFRRVRGPRRQVRYRNGAFVCETFYSYSRSERACARCFRVRAFGIRVTARRTILARPEKRGGTPRDTVGRIPVHTQVATASSSRSCRSRLEARSLLISTHETDRIRLVNSAAMYTLLFPTRTLIRFFVPRM